MNVNAVNSMSFKSNSAYAEHPQMPVLPQETMDTLNKIADKANSDVHPSTIIATCVAVVAAAYSVKNLIPYARRAAVQVGKVISETAVKSYTAIANKFKKNKIDPTKTLDDISSRAKELINGKKGSELPKNIADFVAPILGKSSEEVQQFITKKLNVNNGIEAFDAAAALAAGALTLDPVSDKVEEHNDAKDIVDGIAEML